MDRISTPMQVLPAQKDIEELHNCYLNSCIVVGTLLKSRSDRKEFNGVARHCRVMLATRGRK